MRKKPISITIKCKYCGLKLSHNRLSRHLKLMHGYNIYSNPSEEYYKKYLKTNEQDGTCVCGCQTKFLSIMRGYREFCSHKCADSSTIVKKRREKTFLKSYGVSVVSKLDITKQKQQEINDKRSKEDWKQIHKKKQQTKLKKYGDKDYMMYGSCSYNKKLVEKYGDKDYMKFGSDSFVDYMNNKTCDGDPYNRDKESCIEKRKQTCLDKYGVDNPSKDKEIYAKALQVKLDKYGSIINYNGKASKISKKLFDVLSEEYDIIYNEHPKEYFLKIHDKLYFLDCLYKNTKKVIEVYGDYWHCNPNIYKKDGYVTFPNNKTMLVEDVWNEDEYRIKNIEKEGYTVLIIWETEINNNFEYTIEKCKKFFINDVDSKIKEK